MSDCVLNFVKNRDRHLYSLYSYNGKKRTFYKYLISYELINGLKYFFKWYPHITNNEIQIMLQNTFPIYLFYYPYHQTAIFVFNFACLGDLVSTENFPIALFILLHLKIFGAP